MGNGLTERNIKAVRRNGNSTGLPAIEGGPLETAREDTLLPTPGIFCLLTFCFVAFSHKLPRGTFAAMGAIIAAALRGRQFSIPSFYRWYLVYVGIGALGLSATRYPEVVSLEFVEVVKIALIGIAACNVISTPRAARTFVVWYLALFALYPVRGALYNYIHGF